MKNLEQLQAERKELHAQLDLRNNPMPIVAKLKENERQIEAIKNSQMLTRVNSEQERKRELGKLVYECEQPTEDITTNDGSLHKTKAKKYPKLSSLNPYYIEFKDGRITEMKVSGERFQLYKAKYSYGNPTEYTRPATFAEFLELNSIQAEDISEEQFADFSQKLAQANAEIEAAIEKYSQQREALNTHQMQHIGLVTQSNKHLYIYEARKGY